MELSQVLVKYAGCSRSGRKQQHCVILTLPASIRARIFFPFRADRSAEHTGDDCNRRAWVIRTSLYHLNSCIGHILSGLYGYSTLLGPRGNSISAKDVRYEPGSKSCVTLGVTIRATCCKHSEGYSTLLVRFHVLQADTPLYAHPCPAPPGA